jgi:outer membrane protein OmpA-like peptidoglycan-associated protein
LLAVVASLSLSCAARHAAIQQARLAEEGRERMYFSATPVAEVRFGVGTAVLSASSRSTLAGLTERLRQDGSSFYLEVQGHADTSGQGADNRRLAETRAEAVRRYLHVTGGIPLPRISVVVLGTSVPAADNATAEGRAQNRRVVVVAVRSDEDAFRPGTN